MRIYSMTATFGKLSRETLTLEPGLNLLHAPNEWGKSTWCAFLLAMLYGLDTRAKSTRSALADKERYAPWSGAPMAGRIDLNWNGRDITIERTTRGRIPMGVFRAYETATGLEVPELNAANCGEKLLGAEQSVYRRTGFIRLTDLPVTQDDALRTRLNALVTTGDESGDAARLEKGLRDLKNRIRYNRSGELPQAQAQREQLADRIAELKTNAARQQTLADRIGETQAQLEQLQLHLDTLDYRQAQEDAENIRIAREEYDAAQKEYDRLSAQCAPLPAAQTAREQIGRLQAFRQTQEEVQAQLRVLAPPPEMPKLPKPFRGMEPEEMMAAAEYDRRICREAAGSGTLPMLFSALSLLLALGLMLLELPLWAAAALILGAALLVLGISRRSACEKVCSKLRSKYGAPDPETWVQNAAVCAGMLQQWKTADRAYRGERARIDSRLAQLKQEHTALCGDASAAQLLQRWQMVLESRDALERARLELEQTQRQLTALTNMARQAQLPQQPDSLTLSRGDTLQQLQQLRQELAQLQGRLSQQQGAAQALGSIPELQRELEKTDSRIARLEQLLRAAEMALDALHRASAQLQRRFSPQITARAEQILSSLTGGRYDRLRLSENFALNAGTVEEETLHDVLWRSDGTVDQLYLALRLAVREALIPQAPLVLDDALVRFDDARLRSALQLLRSLGDRGQILLFTCTSREEKLME